MKKVSVAINGRTFHVRAQEGGLDLSAFVDEGDSECSEPCVVDRGTQEDRVSSTRSTIGGFEGGDDRLLEGRRRSST